MNICHSKLQLSRTRRLWRLSDWLIDNPASYSEHLNLDSLLRSHVSFLHFFLRVLNRSRPVGLAGVEHLLRNRAVQPTVKKNAKRTIHCFVILQINATRCTILLRIFISLLYMFRTSMCISSGEFTLSMRHRYLSICTGGVWSAGWSFTPTSRPDATHTEWQIPVSHT